MFIAPQKIPSTKQVQSGKVLYARNDFAAMPGAARRCVLFSFARRQQLLERIGIATNDVVATVSKL